MGEAKRRKKLSPNYEKYSQVVIDDAMARGSRLDEMLSTSTPYGKLSFGVIAPPSKEIDDMAKKVSRPGSVVPRGCSVLPLVLNDAYIGMLFTKSGYSHCVFTPDTMPPPQTLKFLQSNEIVFLALELFKYCESIGRIRPI